MTSRRTFLTQAAVGALALSNTSRVMGAASNSTPAAISPALLERAESLLITEGLKH